MNREQRRKQAKENRRANSKKNFAVAGVQSLPIDLIQHDPNLKECDPELLNMLQSSYGWKIRSQTAKSIINEGLDYMDSLCALRFDITPVEDKVLVRNTMEHISNMANWFIGNCIDGDDMSISEKAELAHKTGTENVRVTMPEDAIHYELKPLPDNDAIDDIYAGFVVSHAHKLAPLLAYARLSDIKGDRKHVFDVLEFITRKTKELLPEAQVDSSKYIVTM